MKKSRILCLSAVLGVVAAVLVYCRMADTGRAAPVQPANETEQTTVEYGGALAREVPSGMRGFTVPVSAETSVAGFLAPRDKVDVLFAWQDGEATHAKIVLQGVELLAIDEKTNGEYTAGSRPKANVPVRMATLSVHPHQAETLAACLKKGQIHLALRPEGENQYVATKGTHVGKKVTAIPSAKPVQQSSVPAKTVRVLPIERPTITDDYTVFYPKVKEPEKEEVVIYRGTEKTVEIIEED